MTKPAFPGYLAPSYGQSFAEFGDILTLERSGMQLIRRPLPHDMYDLIGLYPYVMCRDWSALGNDLQDLHGKGAVSVVFVGDPFEASAVAAATQGWALSRPFKTHFTVDLRENWRRARSKEVRRLSRIALETQRITSVDAGATEADALWALYQNTIERHKVTGIQRLSLKCLTAQLLVPGLVLVAAHDDSGLTGAITAFIHETTAVAHLEFLAAGSHAKRTSYGLISVLLETLEARGCHEVTLGGCAGLLDDMSDGLAQFKSKWATGTRQAMLCGAVLDAAVYDALSASTDVAETDFFPRYRAPLGRLAWTQ